MTAGIKLGFPDEDYLREDRIDELLSFCSQVDFATVDLSEEEKYFRGELNQEILALCSYLPRSTRTNASLFLFDYLQGALTGEINFVNYFYAPAWSILYWLKRSCTDSRKLDQQTLQDAKTGHTMAMFLHAFDDHLNDGQLPVTHLALLMRSQSWMVMSQAFERLAKGVEDGADIVRGNIDDYYASIATTDERSLDCYCAQFRRQMATALVSPVLLARKICQDEEFSRFIQSAYCSFGIAWRLIDDIQDLEEDMIKGVQSSIYVCLNEELKFLWDKHTEEKEDQIKDYSQAILSYVLDKKVVDTIMERAINELDSAASIADVCNMKGLANEFRCLVKPLRKGLNRP